MRFLLGDNDYVRIGAIGGDAAHIDLLKTQHYRINHSLNM